jgi:lipopolysaccharide transport system ATP-binding protein
MTKPAIEIENLSKLFYLGKLGYGTLRETLNQHWARLRGRTPPEAMRSTARPAQAGPKPNTFWALRNVSATIHRGEIVGIIGRNGAGKSTLLKILSKITAPTEGRVILRGTVGSLLEIGAGFHPELSGRENIFLNGAILGMKKADISRQLDDIIAFADVGPFIDTPVKRYSSGMYVRLAFAVAAHLEPDILIVDEVLAVGDARFQKKCLGKMQEISANHGRTVLFVSHNLESVQRLCNQCLYLDSGRLMMQGPTREVIRQYLGANGADRRAEQWIDLRGLPREGVGPGRFQRLRFSSRNPLAAGSAYSDGPLEFELVIESNAPTRIQSIAIGLRDEAGRRLLNADIGVFGHTYDIMPGETAVRLRIEELHLRPGVYSIALWMARYAGEAVSSGDIVDYIEKAFELEVIELSAEENRTSIGHAGVVTCNFELLEFARAEPSKAVKLVP